MGQKSIIKMHLRCVEELKRNHSCQEFKHMTAGRYHFLRKKQPPIYFRKKTVRKEKRNTGIIQLNELTNSYIIKFQHYWN